MSTNNLELFDSEHAQYGESLDNIESMALLEHSKIWTQTLKDFVDLFISELMRQGESKERAQKMALKLVALQAQYFGGRVYYLPKGEKLKSAVRDITLFHEYQKGNGNVQILANKYKLTDAHVYSIIREQIALHRRRHQIDMFSTESPH